MLESLSLKHLSPCLKEKIHKKTHSSYQCGTLDTLLSIWPPLPTAGNWGDKADTFCTWPVGTVHCIHSDHARYVTCISIYPHRAGWALWFKENYRFICAAKYRLELLNHILFGDIHETQNFTSLTKANALGKMILTFFLLLHYKFTHKHHVNCSFPTPTSHWSAAHVGHCYLKSLALSFEASCK